MISAAIALLGVRLASGCLLAAGIIEARAAVPPAFLRFILAIGAVGFWSAAAFAWGRPDALVWAALGTGALGLRFAARRFGQAAPDGGVAGSGSRPRWLAPALIVGGLAGAGVAPFLATGPAVSMSGPGFAAAVSLAGALLLGAVAATMILGHWYLVDTALSIRPLATGAAVFLAASWLRVAVVSAGLVASGYGALRLTSPADLIYSTTALFFSFRVITGLVAPVALAFLIRQTVRIRSTQSATGLLYVALILVLFGELTAIFLEMLTGGALA